MSRPAIVFALLVLLPTLLLPVSAASCAPSEDAFLNLNGRAYMSLDGHIYLETNGRAGFQSSNGSCGDDSWVADTMLL